MSFFIVAYFLPYNFIDVLKNPEKNNKHKWSCKSSILGLMTRKLSLNANTSSGFKYNYNTCTCFIFH
jgi:hypothetical protein